MALKNKNLDKDLLICMAKAPMSLSDDAKLIGAPKGFTLHVKDVTLSNTSFAIYFTLGNLYSGSSDIYVLLVSLNTNFFHEHST